MSMIRDDPRILYLHGCRCPIFLDRGFSCTLLRHGTPIFQHAASYSKCNCMIITPMAEYMHIARAAANRAARHKGYLASFTHKPRPDNRGILKTIYRKACQYSNDPHTSLYWPSRLYMLVLADISEFHIPY